MCDVQRTLAPDEFCAAVHERRWLDAVCAMGAECYPGSPWRHTLADWTDQASAEWTRARYATSRIDSLNRLLLSVLGVKAISASAHPEAMYIQTVLERRLGNCLGLVTLYLQIAESLRIPFVPVLRPAHVFVRYDDGDLTRDIETTSPGGEGGLLSGSPSNEKGQRRHDRVLSMKEFLAVAIVSQATYRHGSRRHWPLAMRDLDLALELFPGCTYAYLDRAVVWRMLGDESNAKLDIARALGCDQQDACWGVFRALLPRWLRGGEASLSQMVGLL